MVGRFVIWTAAASMCGLSAGVSADAGMSVPISASQSVQHTPDTPRDPTGAANPAGVPGPDAARVAPGDAIRSRRLRSAADTPNGMSSSGLLLQGSGSRVVVAHDVNTLSTSLARPDQEVAFAVNVADWLTEGSQGKPTLLLLEAGTDAARDYSMLVEQGLSNAGYEVVVTRDISWTAGQLAQFDAVFFGMRFPEGNGINQNAIIDYLAGGGAAYIFGGVNDTLDDRSATNLVLASVGFRFNGPEHATGSATTLITSGHPIFEGITSLRAGNGNPLEDLLPADPKQVVLIFNGAGLGVYGVFDDRVLGCNVADISPIFGVLDLADINAFVTGFIAQDPIADINHDGLFDLADITLFVIAFVAGCP